jgi:HSP20 family protein
MEDSTMITTQTRNRSVTHPIAQALDRMGSLGWALDQVLTPTAGEAAPVWIPALEIAERPDAYLIAAELPGVREDQIELSFENNELTIRGAKTGSFATDDDGLRVHLVERQTGTFQRAVRLPEYVEGDRIAAHFVDGVLQVTVPKSPAAQPRRIPVSTDATRRLGDDGAGREAPTS